VTRVQKLASRAAAQNRHVIVVGNPNHPEMIGVQGYAPSHAFVVKDASEIAALPRLKNPLVVSQTTINCKLFSTRRKPLIENRRRVQSSTRLLGDSRSSRRGAALAGKLTLFTSSADVIRRTAANYSPLSGTMSEKFSDRNEEEINPQDLIGAQTVG
jgi:4-hydroxy-3-methylbut-2-enyl diphosphate reductase